MDVSKLLDELEKSLKQERELLLKFPLTNPEQILKIQEEIRKVLYELSKLPKEAFAGKENKLRRILELNARVSSLISNQLSFLEDLEKEVFGETLTYEKRNANNIFNGRA